MGELVELAALRFVVEDDSSERGAIEGAVRCDHAVAEMLPDGVEDGARRLYDFASEGVGIDDHCAAPGQHPGDGRLARTDAAGEPDDQLEIGGSVGLQFR